jgi:hypothetical protein
MWQTRTYYIDATNPETLRHFLKNLARFRFVPELIADISKNIFISNRKQSLIAKNYSWVQLSLSNVTVL